jgi:hypothetical protein
MNKTQITLLLILISGVSLPSMAAAENEAPNQQIVSREYLKPAGSRSFAIEYIGKLSGVTNGAKKLRVWMPVPQDSTVQTIRELSFSRPPRLTTEPKDGNKIAYWEFDNPTPYM